MGKKKLLARPAYISCRTNAEKAEIIGILTKAGYTDYGNVPLRPSLTLYVDTVTEDVAHVTYDRSYKTVSAADVLAAHKRGETYTMPGFAEYSLKSVNLAKGKVTIGCQTGTIEQAKAIAAGGEGGAA